MKRQKILDRVKRHVRRDDRVIVLAGKDRGKVGKIIRVVTKKNRVYVEKINMIKRHARPSQANPQGGIIEREGPVQISNVMVVCPGCGEPTRSKRVDLEGRRVRACKKCGEIIDR